MTYYNETAQGYNELHKDEQCKKLKIITDHLHVKKYEKLLDVGCGTGFSKYFFDCNWTGIDPSKELLSQCKGKTILGKAESLHFLDNSFDIVISVTAIHNFDNIEKGLREIIRIGKGKFVFSILKKSNRFKEINALIKGLLKVDKTIDEGIDMIYICSI